MSSMEQRKAEIAAKKQRLAEIKRRNAERQSSTSRRSQDVSEARFRPADYMEWFTADTVPLDSYSGILTRG